MREREGVGMCVSECAYLFQSEREVVGVSVRESLIIKNRYELTLQIQIIRGGK